MWVENDRTVLCYRIIIVILLVRMWVEKLYCRSNGYNKGSSSLWGCELKTACSSRQWIPLRHPPCEDVSWKIAGELSDSLGKVILLVRMWVEKTKNIRQQYIAIVILLVRMWVEKLFDFSISNCNSRHPPCEDVSWKFDTMNPEELQLAVILLVRMWVEKF